MVIISNILTCTNFLIEKIKQLKKCPIKLCLFFIVLTQTFISYQRTYLHQALPFILGSTEFLYTYETLGDGAALIAKILLSYLMSQSFNSKLYYFHGINLYFFSCLMFMFFSYVQKLDHFIYIAWSLNTIASGLINCIRDAVLYKISFTGWNVSVIKVLKYYGVFLTLLHVSYVVSVRTSVIIFLASACLFYVCSLISLRTINKVIAEKDVNIIKESLRHKHRKLISEFNDSGHFQYKLGFYIFIMSILANSFLVCDQIIYRHNDLSRSIIIFCKFICQVGLGFIIFYKIKFSIRTLILLPLCASMAYGSIILKPYINVYLSSFLLIMFYSIVIVIRNSTGIIVPYIFGRYHLGYQSLAYLGEAISTCFFNFLYDTLMHRYEFYFILKLYFAGIYLVLSCMGLVYYNIIQPNKNK